MAKAKKNQKKTIVAFVLDRSGSMSGITGKARLAYNEMLESVRKRSEDEGHFAAVSLVMFSGDVEVVHHPVNAKVVKPLETYPAYGSTAMLDAFGKAVEVLRGSGFQDDPDVSFLVIVFTDGEENCSFIHNVNSVKKLIADLEVDGRWTLAFNVPPGSKNSITRFGIPAENVREWEATEKGVQETKVETQSAISTYFQARSAGKKAVKNFYDVTVDTSKLKAKTVRSELDDLSDKFKVLDVPKEVSVKEFVESKQGGKPYVIGSAYYQLTKTEKVQPNKEILIREKGKKAIWGGDQARDLVGLPTDGVTHAKVSPGNLGNYDLFVKSTSVNRKLVRGTSLLLDVTKKKDDSPTWTAAVAA